MASKPPPMKPTNYACSMSLGDNPEMARERYESLKGELIKMGRVESIGNDNFDAIRIINNGRFYHTNTAFLSPKHGQLLEAYNRSLFLAIAGQKVGGGVGCWYVHNNGKEYPRQRVEINSSSIALNGRGVTSFMSAEILESDYHLATIEELIEAFTNPTCEENAQDEKGNQAKDDWRNNPCMSRYERRIKLEAEVKKLKDFKDYVHWRLDQAGIPTHPDGEHSKHGCRIGDRLDIALHHANENVLENDLISVEDIERALAEPEPRKIKKGDKLLCVDDKRSEGVLIKGEYYTALDDEEIFSDPQNNRINVLGQSFYAERFTIANEEAEPVKEEPNEAEGEWETHQRLTFSSGNLSFTFIVKENSIDLNVSIGNEWHTLSGLEPTFRAVLAKYDELKAL